MNFTALVVEDDHLQREVLSDILRDEGLEVVECTTAEAAELVVASMGTELKAIITDVTLAGDMSGLELAQYAKRRFPHIDVVLVSGQQPTFVPHKTKFLMKPYDKRQILDAMQWDAP